MLRRVLVRQLKMAVMVRNLVEVAVNIAFQLSQSRYENIEEFLKVNTPKSLLICRKSHAMSILQQLFAAGLSCVVNTQSLLMMHGHTSRGKMS